VEETWRDSIAALSTGNRLAHGLCPSIHEVVTSSAVVVAAIVIGGSRPVCIKIHFAVALRRTSLEEQMAILESCFPRRPVLALLLAPLVACAALPARAAEPAVSIPAPKLDPAIAATAKPQTVVLAGGCFWGVQAVFQHTKGVTAAVSGYAGGAKQTAQYDVVSTGRTGHAESVAVTFDPRQISLGRIFQIYFSVAHNPTELNRQGPDVGSQYRSAIFYSGDEQKQVAAAYIAELQNAHVFKAPIVTRLEPLHGFYPAEDYHQDFAVLHPSYPYIVFNDLPKVKNLKAMFPEFYRDKPVTVMATSKTGE
jgi:peptide-methionine (S)-S-oxide reductase